MPLPSISRGLRALWLPAALLVAGCPSAKPVEIILDPTPLDGTLLESRRFDIWLIPAPEEGKPAEQTRIGVLLERRVRQGGEMIHCEERRTVNGRGQVLISTWQKTLF